MLFTEDNALTIFYKTGGKTPLRWGIGPAANPITEGAGNWNPQANWHRELIGTPKAIWKEAVSARFGGGTAGAIGTGIIDTVQNHIVGSIIFEPVFGGGFYRLVNNSLRMLDGLITVNNPVGAQIESALTGTKGLTKAGPGELRLSSNPNLYTFSGNTTVNTGILYVSGTTELLPNSDLWIINIDFNAAPILSNSGRMRFDANVTLGTKTVNMLVNGATSGRWIAGLWLGNIIAKPIFQVNGVIVAVPNVANPFFSYLTTTRVFYYQPQTGTGAGTINPSFGIVNNWSSGIANGTPGVHNFVVPSGVYVLKVWCIGAGGAGGGTRNANDNAGAGGGGGGACWKTFNVRPGDTISYTVGNGGNGAANQNGTAGTDTTLTHLPTGTVLRAYGGRGGGRHRRPPNGVANGGDGGAAGIGGDGGIKGGDGGSPVVNTVQIQSASGGAFGNVAGQTAALAVGGQNAAEISLSNHAFGLGNVALPLKSGNSPRNGNGGNGDFGCGGGGAGAQNTRDNRGGHGGNGIVLIAW